MNSFSDAFVEWRTDATGHLSAWLRARPDVRVAWAPQPGSQTAFLSCPVQEAIAVGGRGWGKTDALLMDFAQHVGRGYGADWRGILFRRTYPELADVIEKSRRWFAEIFPDAVYNKSSHTWTFATGEVLIFSFADSADDYWKHHGHAYTWIGWEELTAWASDAVYRAMFSCLRTASTKVDDAGQRMPLKVRATTNPAGRGHNWVKARFHLPVPAGRIAGDIIAGSNGVPDRVAIQGHLRENRVLLHADPEYRGKLIAAADSESKLRAWRDGSWDILAGGMFDDLWRSEIHVVPPIPPEKIPAGWRLDRSYDDGQSKPFSVGWWAESNGEFVEWEGQRLGEVRGDLFRIAEWYGCIAGRENEGLNLASREIATGIRQREAEMKIAGRVRPGPADTAIWNASATDRRTSVASVMAAEGVSWTPADKGPGSRKQGWQAVRGLLRGALPSPTGGKRELAGLFVSAACPDFLRTFPTAPRDERDPDDVDSDSEDHQLDDCRYRVRRAPPSFVKITPRPSR